MIINFLYIVATFILGIRVKFSRFVSTNNFCGVFRTELLLSEILLVSGQSSS